MGKSTISMAIFNSFLLVYQRVLLILLYNRKSPNLHGGFSPFFVTFRYGRKVPRKHRPGMRWQKNQSIWDTPTLSINKCTHKQTHIIIYICIHRNHTSSTAQGGGGSFKNRKAIGEVGCCESGMAERSHCWSERWLMSLSLSLSLTIYLPTHLPTYLSTYVSIDLSTYRSFYLSIYLSLSHLSICLAVYLSICLSIYLSVCLSICLPVYLWCSVIQCNVV